MHRDLPSETLILGLADTRKPKNTHYGACLCGNLWAPALGTHVPTTVHTVHEASHAKVTTLLWDRTATTLWWVCVSYLVVNIPKEPDVPAWSTPPSGSYAHVCTPSTLSHWFYPAQEGGLAPPLHFTCSRVSPSYLFLRARSGGLALLPSVSTTGWPRGAPADTQHCLGGTLVLLWNAFSLA